MKNCKNSNVLLHVLLYNCSRYFLNVDSVSLPSVDEILDPSDLIDISRTREVCKQRDRANFTHDFILEIRVEREGNSLSKDMAI